MKRLIMLLLAIIFVFSLSAIANAGQGGGGYQSGGGANPYAGSNHGGYTATTNACKKCHAVHNALGANGAADATSYKLMRYRAGEQELFGACNFCHDATGMISSKRVYTKTVPDSSPTTAKHSLGSGTTNIPDSTSNDSLGSGTVNQLDCIDCHRGAPHGAVDGAPVAPSTKLTNVVDPGGAGSNDFCKTCHDRNYVTTVNGNGHRVEALASDNSGSGGKKIAGQDAGNCVSCHNSAKKAAGGDFPHSADDGGRFLGGNINASASSADGAASDSRLTAKCFQCHRWNGDTEGVGLTF